MNFNEIPKMDGNTQEVPIGEAEASQPDQRVESGDGEAEARGVIQETIKPREALAIIDSGNGKEAKTVIGGLLDRLGKASPNARRKVLATLFSALALFGGLENKASAEEAPAAPGAAEKLENKFNAFDQKTTEWLNKLGQEVTAAVSKLNLGENIDIQVKTWHGTFGPQAEVVIAGERYLVVLGGVIMGGSAQDAVKQALADKNILQPDFKLERASGVELTKFTLSGVAEDRRVEMDNLEIRELLKKLAEVRKLGNIEVTAKPEHDQFGSQCRLVITGAKGQPVEILAIAIMGSLSRGIVDALKAELGLDKK